MNISQGSSVNPHEDSLQDEGDDSIALLDAVLGGNTELQQQVPNQPNANPNQQQNPEAPFVQPNIARTNPPNPTNNLVNARQQAVNAGANPNLPYVDNSLPGGSDQMIIEENFGAQQTSPQQKLKDAFWKSQPKKNRDREGELNAEPRLEDKIFSDDSAKSQQNEMIVDKNNTLRTQIYYNLDRQGIFLPKLSSNAITTEALENHAHGDFFYITKSVADAHKHKSHKMRFDVNFVYEVLQRYLHAVFTKNILPYKNTPNKEFVSIIAYHSDPGDTLGIRPKEKPKHDFTISIQQHTGAVRLHNQVPAITQIYTHIDQVQKTINTYKTKQVSTTANFNDTKKKCISQLERVDQFSTHVSKDMAFQIKKSTAYQNLKTVADKNSNMDNLEKLNETANAGILKEIAGDDLIKAYEASYKERPQKFFSKIPEKPQKKLPVEHLPLINLHDIYLKNGLEYLKNFVKEMREDELTPANKAELETIRAEHRTKITMEKQRLIEQCTELKEFFNKIHKKQRIVARSKGISCHNNLKILNDIAATLPNSQSATHLHKIRVKLDDIALARQKISKTAIPRVEFDLEEEDDGLDIESVSMAPSYFSQRTNFRANFDQADDPLTFFNKVQQDEELKRQKEQRRQQQATAMQRELERQQQARNLERITEEEVERLHKEEHELLLRMQHIDEEYQRLQPVLDELNQIQAQQDQQNFVRQQQLEAQQKKEETQRSLEQLRAAILRATQQPIVEQQQQPIQQPIQQPGGQPHLEMLPQQPQQREQVQENILAPQPQQQAPTLMNRGYSLIKDLFKKT